MKWKFGHWLQWIQDFTQHVWKHKYKMPGKKRPIKPDKCVFRCCFQTYSFAIILVILMVSSFLTLFLDEIMLHKRILVYMYLTKLSFPNLLLLSFSMLSVPGPILLCLQNTTKKKKENIHCYCKAAKTYDWMCIYPSCQDSFTAV